MLSNQSNIGAVSLRYALSNAKVFGSADISVTAVCTSPENVRPGDLYVAVVDDAADGHDGVAEAVAQGAGAVLAERLVPANVPVATVKDTRQAIGQLCHQLAGDPCTQMRTVAVSGTSGKTSVCRLIDSIFRAAGQTVESWDDCSGRSHPMSAPETTAWMHQLVRKDVQNSVVEISSRELSERRPWGMKFDAAIINSIAGADLSRHRNFKNYQRAQLRMLDLLKQGGVAILNADDPGFDEFAAHIDQPSVTFGMHAEADISASIVERHSSEQTFLIHVGDECVPVRTAIVGDHHIRNCLAATAFGLLSGVDLATIVCGLEAVSRLPGRMERIECGQPFSVFVDGAQSPHRLKTVLKAARQSARGKVHVVVGCDSRLEEDLRPLLARICEVGADHVVLTADNPGDTPPLQIAHDMLDGVERTSKVLVRPDRAGAIEHVLASAKPGDAVVIVGKGDRTGQWIGDQWSAFDDRSIARTMLYAGVHEPGEPASVRPRLRVVG